MQSFERKFDPNDPDIKIKLGEYSETLIQQIDTMSSIASAFSNFAKMPERKDEVLSINDVIDSAMDIFSQDGVSFKPADSNLNINFDRTQLIRVITNLVKNAIQAIPNDRTPEIEVRVEKQGDDAFVFVKDNGLGIETENKSKIFEPNFTTKTSGMGLGLAMVKSIVETYAGSIDFTSQVNKGTEFQVRIPLHSEIK